VRGALSVLILALTGCPSSVDPEPEPTPAPWVERDIQVRWDPADGTDYWRVGMPSDLRLQDDGTWDLSDWPGGQDDDLVAMWLNAADRRLVEGWGVSSGVVTTFSGPIDAASLGADAAPTLEDDAPVYLIDVDPDSPERGRRLPIRPRFSRWGSDYAPDNLLTAVPVWGHVRRPETTYALVVTDRVTDESGDPVGRSRAFHDAFEGADGADAALVAHLAPLKATLEATDAARVVGAAVFTTLDVDRQLRALGAWAETQPLPEQAEPWTVVEEFASYTVLRGRFRVPVIQGGERPYSELGEGLIVWDGDAPVVQETQDVRLALTIPKAPMPDDGFPLLMYLHGSGGNWTQAIDRGPVDENGGGGPPGPGMGPAEWLARRGIATVGHDFPLHGDRHDPPDVTGLQLYNLLGNIDATIDNFDVSAMELTLLSRFMLAATVDQTLDANLDAGGAADGLIRFDEDRLTAMGQSMGTTLGVPWATIDGRLDGAVWSGAGGILVEIATTAVEPFDIRPLLAYRLGVEPDELDESHPLLHAFQNLWDLVDPIAKAEHVTLAPHEGVAPKHFLMTAGVRDGYFHPRSEAAMAAALGAELVGDEVEPILPEVLSLDGRATQPYPLTANLSERVAGVVLYAAPNTLGHYVVFNQEGARHQYTCFVASVGTTNEAISAAGSLDDPCP